MMSQETDAREGFEALRKIVGAMVPDTARQFGRGNWAAIVSRIAKGVDLQINIVEGGYSWSVRYRVEITDPTGAAWPHGQFNERHLLKTPDLETRSEAEAILTEIKAFQDRLSPMAE